MKTALLTSLFFGILGCHRLWSASWIFVQAMAAEAGTFFRICNRWIKSTITYSGWTDLHYGLEAGLSWQRKYERYWFPRGLNSAMGDQAILFHWQDSLSIRDHALLFIRSMLYSCSRAIAGDHSVVKEYSILREHPFRSCLHIPKIYRGTDPDNYQEAERNACRPTSRVGSIGEDSVVFSLKDWSPGAVARLWLWRRHTAHISENGSCRIRYITNGIPWYVR